MAKETKDYSKYFDFSDAKVLSEDEHGKTIRIKGREIHIISEPNHRQSKKRRREEVQVLYETAVPEELRGIGNGKHYIVYTYGCQMNEHDSETIKGMLEEMGYTPTEDRKEADIILLNTCAIRENAEDKVFGELGHLKHLKKKNPGCCSASAAACPKRKTSSTASCKNTGSSISSSERITCTDCLIW